MNNIKTRDIFDLDIDGCEILNDSRTIGQILEFNQMKDRKLYLRDVNQSAVDDIISCILYFNTEDKGIDPDDRVPIRIYISSPGGYVEPGFELMNVIQASKTPVYTINLDMAYSMGFLIYISGHRRYSMVNAKYLIHDGSEFVYNSGSKVKDTIEFNNKVDAKIEELIITRTKITSKEYKKKIRDEWYLFAEDAKEKGIVDFLVGVDCDLDEII